MAQITVLPTALAQDGMVDDNTKRRRFRRLQLVGTAVLQLIGIANVCSAVFGDDSALILLSGIVLTGLSGAVLAGEWRRYRARSDCASS